MKILYTLIAVLLVQGLFAQECANGRYVEPIFNRLDIKKDIVYAKKRQSDGHEIALAYDVYQPYGDTLSLRPVMLLIHGGAYLKLIDQNSPDIVEMCTYFAQRGYVTVSLDYRQEPNPLALFSEETMIKAVARALVDTKDAVDHMIGTVSNGNPYRVDTTRAFIGGVSAGALSSVFITYLDSLAQMPPQYQQWIVEAIGDSADYILRHRFDLVRPKASIIISGATLDTGWIVNNGIDLFLNHGSTDPIVPYRFGYPLGINTLPKLYGGKDMYPRALNQGIRVEFEDWIGRGHVPFMNLSFPEIITGLINPEIFDSTMRNIARFIYPHLNCGSVISGIKQHNLGKLNLYPNPNSGDFTLQLPKGNAEWRLQVYSTTGQLMLDRILPQGVEMIAVNEGLPAGMYYAKLSSERGQVIDYYAGAFAVAK